MATREELHRLVDELPDDELEAARRYLQYLRDYDNYGDPLVSALADAPCDDELTTDEEDATAREAWNNRHDGISADEARRKYL
jgi:hypothetical protein